jgi:dCMP deaminase
MTRPDWDTYFLGIMDAVAARATCDRGRSGAVIVRNKRLLATGYVGSPVGLAHCDEAGHYFKTVYHEDGSSSKHCVRTAHAEMNAIVQAARFGVAVDGATIYCRMEPCRDCAKAIINAGIKRVVCQKRYHGAQETREWLLEAGVELVVVENAEETYAEMQ